MSLTGNLKKVSLYEVLQMVSISRATGSLLIRSHFGNGTVNFHLGELVFASIENHQSKLGEQLITQGLITRRQLEQALRTQLTTKPWRSLGVICVEMGVVTAEDLHEVVKGLYTRIVYEIASWKQGIFRFETGAIAVCDQIAMDVRELLHRLDAFSRTSTAASLERLFDNTVIQEEQITEIPAEQARNSNEEDSLQEVVAELFDSQPFRSKQENEQLLKIFRETARLKEVLLSLDEKRSQGEVGLLLLRFASDYLQRVVLFFVKDEALMGLGHFGLQMTEGSIDRYVRSVKIPLQGNQFEAVVNNNQELAGPLDDNTWGLLQPMMSDCRPEQVISIPIKIMGKVSLLLYGDNLQEPITEDLSNLRMFAHQVGMAFEIAFLNQQRQ